MIRPELDRSIDAHLSDAVRLSDWIFDHPETGCCEFGAMEKLTEAFEKEGFSVEKGVGDMPTAFRAVWNNGGGGPSIGLLCEYDALREMGHGCGHHMQGPAVLLAACAVRECLKNEPYRLVVYGTPDEEHGNGKIHMLKNGCFEDIDFALMTHGGPNTTVDIKSLALETIVAEFRGTPSHAAMSPEKGRSAVDAMLLSLHGLEMLREHVREDVRMHYAILETPPAYNIVPDHAKIEYVMRSYSSDYLQSVAGRLEKVIRGAAYMTETDVTLVREDGVQSKIPVCALNDRIMTYAEEMDAPQRIPFREKTGSTDFGNVLHKVPGACVRVAFVPEGTPSHSQGFIDAGKGPAMHEAIRLSARIMANVAADLIEDNAFALAVRNEFRERAELEKNGI
jgi:amidohydrolase